MSKQNSWKRIFRCRYCNCKTHHMYWDDKNERCPVCGASAGYHLGNHDGLKEPQIAVEAEKTIKFLLQLKKDGAITLKEEERLNWLQQRWGVGVAS